MNQESSPSALTWPVTQAVAVLMVLGFFLFSLWDFLNPILLYLVLLALLIPFRSYRHQPLLITLATVLTLFWVVESLGTLLAPFLVAMGLAYLLDPAVDRFEARGFSRTLGIVIMAGPLLAALAVVGIFGVPALGQQVGALIGEAPVILDRIVAFAGTLETRLEQVPWVGEYLRAQAERLDPEQVVTALQARQAEIAQRAWAGVVGVGRGVGSALTVLSYVILTPVITFYLLRDWDGMVERTMDLIPVPNREDVHSFLGEFDGLLGRFLRGQITVATLMGFLTFVGLWLWGFPYAILIGALVTVFSVVPYLGLVLSLLPAVVIALTSGNIGYSLLKVAVVFGVVQGLEGTVISPRIVGDSVGLHPVWVLLAIAAAGYFFGFVGLLLAVPVAVGIKLMVLRLVERYRDSLTYRGELAEAEEG